MAATTTTSPAPGAVVRPTRWFSRQLIAPVAFAVVNGILFLLIRPDVNDLWAARARASAVEHGVGLTYWFSWFGGGTTPGNYSVVTPYLSALVGTELVAALSTAAVTVLAVVALRGTRHPVAAAWVAALASALNLWSGRVPFLLGCVAAVAALIAVRRRQRIAAVGLTFASVLASPVSGAFIGLGLVGTFLATRTRSYRPVIAWTGGAAVLGLGGVALLFGTPGPEPFSAFLLLEVAVAQLCLWCAWPADHLRITLAATLLATLVLFAVPNGMGSNFARFVFFCIPVAVAATSPRRTSVVALAVAPALALGAVTTVKDLVHAVRPISSVEYYRSLAARLDQVSDLDDYRVEVVNHGAHAGYDALLDHAMLARGWQTQEDMALNKSLQHDPLDPVTYKIWLDNNAVGYVALPSSSLGGYPEYTLVQKHGAGYLQPIWSNEDWELFRVAAATPIIARPGSVVRHSQKSMTIRVPCACTIPVRVRWSKFLTATRQAPGPRPGTTAAALPRVRARVVDDGSGWTTLTTTQPGTYVLRGSFRGGFLR
jgi:hypothetical protein